MTKLRWILVGSVGAVAGCGVFFPDLFPPPDDRTAPSLKAFTSEEEFQKYFRGEVASRNDALMDVEEMVNRGDDADAAPISTVEGAPADGFSGGSGSLGPQAPLADSGGTTATEEPSPDGGFSQTTIQEAGVDEADVVKTDGTHLFVIDDTNGQNSVLRIIRANPPDQMAVLSEIPLDGYGRDLYLHEGKVTAITATYGGFIYYDIDIAAEGGVAVAEVKQETESSDDGPASDFVIGIAPVPGDALLPPYEYVRPDVTVTVIDVLDPSNPRTISKTKYDGSASSSRMINGTLYLVLANYQQYFIDVMPRLGAPTFDAEAIDPTTVLPKFEHTDASGNVTSGDLLTWQDLYHPAEPDGFGVVSIVTMNTSQPGDFRAVGVVAEPGLIYASLDALYLTNTNYDYLGNARTSTDIYKLDYENGQAVPRAAGRVVGRVLNQYSMSEFNGFLRVATTLDAQFGPFGQIAPASNGVYVLSEANGALEIIGRLENIAFEETIQSARFVGNKGYLVTFRQIDPLFTLDLSDPTQPRVVGELKVPGFSTFIVPIDENHLLAVGQHIPEESFRPWGVQITIFDVGDFANPVQLHQVVLGQAAGEGGSWSEALYDPKAFTYFADRGLLALPASIYPEYVPPIVDPIFVDPTEPTEPVVVEGGENGSAGAGSAGSGTEPVEGDVTVDSDTGVEVGEEPVETIAPGEPYVPQGFDGLIVYRVSAAEGFSELGRISTRYDQAGYWWTSFTRGVFMDEHVYAVTNLGVRAAPVSAISAGVSELFYGPAAPPEPEPIILEPEVIVVGEGGSAESDGGIR